MRSPWALPLAVTAYFVLVAVGLSHRDATGCVAAGLVLVAALPVGDGDTEGDAG